MLKRSTITKIVEGILAQTKSGIKLPHEDVREETFKRMANEATIILKTALICENEGTDKAMEYYNGTHTVDEFEEFRLETPTPDNISLCNSCNCMTHTLARKDGKGLVFGKCGAIK